MSEKTVRFLLAIILTASMLFVFVCSVKAESNHDAADNEKLNMSETDFPEENEQFTGSTDFLGQTEEAQETTEEIIPADFPALTVNAISNFFPKASAEYNVKTKEVTVTYWLKSSKNVLSTQWTVTYEPEVFTVSEEKNTAETICPAIGGSEVLSFDESGTIKLSSSNLRLFDFSTEQTPFVQIVFDVNELNPDEPITTKIDLTLDVLRVSEIDSETGVSDFEEEISLVDNWDVVEAAGLASVRVNKMTMLTPSNFIQATTVPPESSAPYATDESGNPLFPSSDDEPQETTVEAAAITAGSTENVLESSEDTLSASTNEGETSKDDKTQADMGIVNTGSPGYALICIGVLVVSTSILFVMRKKEIAFYNL